MRIVPFFAGVVTIALGAATGASAAPLSLVGGTAYRLPAAYDLAPRTPGVGPGTEVRANAGLVLGGPAVVTFHYLGSDAADRNQFRAGERRVFDNRAGPNAPVRLGIGAGGLLPIAFRTLSPGGLFENGATVGCLGSIAFYLIGSTSAYALYNDAYRGDRDYDDMAVRIDVAPVPLPAAGRLLLGGLAASAGLAFARRGRPGPA